ncbi:MAG: hypothetical protein K0R00_1373 [Herbinix sp.]|jgi:hypothetical protein|nr:hypothetical protein [Herbinix sp.]
MESIIGVILIIVVTIFLIWIVIRATKYDKSIKDKYDERQALIRGKGYKISFFILTFYNVGYGFVFTKIDLPIDTLTAMMVGILFAELVHVVYCIWKDAYFALNDNPSSVLLAFGFLGFINISLGAINIVSGMAFTDGVLNFRGVSFIIGWFFVAIFIALFAKWLKVKFEAKQEVQ